jgi:asparagine synthase (glutamine-hydrolysing)
MCGIAGAFLRNGVVSSESIKRATKSLNHRGPDGSGSFHEHGLALLHTRLSIIDLAGGRQPLFSDDENLCLVANGEIYNYLELRQQFQSLGYRFATHSDCEPVIAAFQQYGASCLDRLQGMYAFALYDRKKKQLLLVRDRLGIKPLFLQQGEKGVFFASEIKALLAINEQSAQVNPAGLVQFMQNNFTSQETTLYQGIQRVLPGEAVLIEKGRIVKRYRYWKPDHVVPVKSCESDLQQQFSELMEQVMKIHLRSDVPFGLFLSGGVDSAVLLAMLDKYVEGPVSTYSVGFPGASVASELTAANAIAKRYNTQHKVLELHENELLQSLPHAIWSADELMGDYANLPVSLLAQRASQDLKVVFSGEGGDEVFAGYARYRMPAIKRLIKQLRYPGSGGFRMSKTLNSSWKKQLFAEPLLEKRAAWSEPFISCWQESPENWPVMSRMQAVDIQTWLADDLLVKADRMLMAWGMEGRVPFLDHRIVEFGLSLPTNMKMQGKHGKVFLKNWAQQYLPKEHLWGKKRGFTVPVHDWLSGPLLDDLARVLPENMGIKSWFNPKVLNLLLKRQQIKGDMTQPIWRLWQFAIWHRLFIEGDGSMPAANTDPIEIIQ